MYICSCCEKTYKRVPSRVVVYGNASFLLCRRCKDKDKDSRMREHSLSDSQRRALSARLPVPINPDRQRSSAPDHYDFILYISGFEGDRNILLR